MYRHRRGCCKTVPYPTAAAGADSTICFGNMASLNGVTNGSSYSWYPPADIKDFHALHTTALPHSSTIYTLIAYDTKGCPKPGVDSVLITVQPEIPAFAGHDTSIVISQPLQLHASGGEFYQWSPAYGLSSVNTPDPVALFNEPAVNNRYKVLVSDRAGCTDSAFINIKVYKTLPSVFVPTAFTPNNDGHNDIFRPVIAGIKTLKLLIYTIAGATRLFYQNHWRRLERPHQWGHAIIRHFCLDNKSGGLQRSSLCRERYGNTNQVSVYVPGFAAGSSLGCVAHFSSCSTSQQQTTNGEAVVPPKEPEHTSATQQKMPCL